jgi:hypothetical protein
MTRREALQLAAGALMAGSAASAAQKTEGARTMPSLHRYDDYGWLRGFSVVPSWGARIEEAWWFYHPDRFREEIAPAILMHANCMRLWIEFTAWMADPDGVTAAFVDSINAIGDAGMKAMPCLFNRWHDARYDYGGQYTEDLYREWGPKLEYVRTLVEPLATDDRILVWDLCNEPQAFDLSADWGQREYRFLTEVAAVVGESGAMQPVTIGTMFGANIELYAPLCDVLCAHPYVHTEDELAAVIAGCDELRTRLGKPMLANETIPGCLDDLRRAELARYYTRRLSEAGLGWMAWALREGKAISTRRDRHDANGLDGQGFHPFATADGRLRDGLEFLCDPPDRLPPWEA